MAVRLKKLTLRGFRSIRELEDFEPGPINVMIGANGAGKSNLISFFRLLSWMMSSPPELQKHVSIQGGANAILHDGGAVTPMMEAMLALETDKGENEYRFRLTYAAQDTLIFTDEKYRFSRHDHDTEVSWTQLGAGHREPQIVEEADTDKITPRVIRNLLRQCKVYQFHNTSFTARMRGKWDVTDNRQLKEDGANLAPFLLRLRESETVYYKRIVDSIRQVAPFFADFELEPMYNKVLLGWRERNSDMQFNAAQASDGMLRTMALISLLLQPQTDMPDILVLDEPELGLHPYALTLVAGLLRSAAQRGQVVVATQSTALVNHFEPEEIIVVDRVGRESLFHRLDREKLSDWLDEYSISELWEKNVIGGRPSW